MRVDVGRDDWMTAIDHCEWNGIDCTSDGLVSVIDLFEHGLSGVLPPVRIFQCFKFWTCQTL